MDSLHSHSYPPFRPKLLTRFILLVVFGTLGFLANWFKVEIFFNVDFLFGSFFTMVALSLFGLRLGAAVGFIASLCTFFLWNHPWAVVIGFAEALFVGVAYHRKRNSLLFWDVVYWLVLGAPLVFVFYHLKMGIDLQATFLVMLKQSINGVVNALVASGVVLLISFSKSSFLNWDSTQLRRPPLGEVVFVVLVSFVLIPNVAITTLNCKAMLEEEKTDLLRVIDSGTELAQSDLTTWKRDKERILQSLNDEFGPPAEGKKKALYAHLKFLNKSEAAFRRFGAFDAKGIAQVYIPELDYRGKPVVGQNYSDRPYFPYLKTSKQLYGTDVLESRVEGPGRSFVGLMLPVWKNEVFSGFYGGIIDTNSLLQILKNISNKRNLHLTLVDRQGVVIVSDHPDFKYPLGGQFGSVTPTVSRWIAPLEPGVSVMQRWKNSYFERQFRFPDDLGWTLIAQSSLLPLFERLTTTTIRNFLLMAFLILISTLVSYGLSRRLVSSLSLLGDVTQKLPSRILSGEVIHLPESQIAEVGDLIHNVREMCLALKKSFSEKQMLMKDVHDGIGGIISNISMLSQYTEDKNILQKISGLAKEGVVEVRSFMNSAESNETEWADMLAEMKDYAKKMLSPHGIRFELISKIEDGNVATSAYTYLNIIRVFRELITNIIKHSHATAVEVGFSVKENHFELVVQDNGVGFECDQVKSRGLFNIQTRAAQLNAKWFVQNVNGTRASLVVPLN